MRAWLRNKMQSPLLASGAEWMWQLTNMPLSMSLTALTITLISRLFRSS